MRAQLFHQDFTAQGIACRSCAFIPPQRIDLFQLVGKSPEVGVLRAHDVALCCALGQKESGGEGEDGNARAAKRKLQRNSGVSTSGERSKSRETEMHKKARAKRS